MIVSFKTAARLLPPVVIALLAVAGGTDAAAAEAEAPTRLDCPVVSPAELAETRSQAARAGHPVHDGRALGLPATRFSDIPVDTLEKLKSQVRRHRSELCQVLRMAGWPGRGEDFFAAIEALDESAERQLAPGTRLQWMALRRDGTPALQHNFRWAGAEPFAAWEVVVRSGDYETVFVIPWSCLNLSLDRITALMRECTLEASFDPAAELITVDSATASRVNARKLDPATGAPGEEKLPIERVTRGRWQLRAPETGVEYRFTGCADPTGDRPGGCCRSVLRIPEPACVLSAIFDPATQRVRVTSSGPAEIETPRLASGTAPGASAGLIGDTAGWSFSPPSSGWYGFTARTAENSLRPGESCFASVQVLLEPPCRRPAMAHPGVRQRFATWNLGCAAEPRFVRTLIRPVPEAEQCVQPPVDPGPEPAASSLAPEGLRITVREGEPLADWLREVVPAFGIAFQPDQGWGLDLVGRRSSLGGTHLEFQQTLRGRRVIDGGSLKINLDHDGCVVSLFGTPALEAPPPALSPVPTSPERSASRTARDASPSPPPPPPPPPAPPVYISPGEAIVLAIERLRESGSDSPYASGEIEWTELPRVEEVWYAGDGGLEQAYRVTMVCHRPPAAWEYVISISGEILEEIRHIARSAQQPPETGGGTGGPRDSTLPASFARKYGDGWQVLRDGEGRLSGLLRITVPSGPAPDPREFLRDAAEAFDVGVEDVEELPATDRSMLEFQGRFQFGEARVCGRLQVSLDFAGHVRSLLLDPLADGECGPPPVAEVAAPAAAAEVSAAAALMPEMEAGAVLSGGRSRELADPMADVFVPSPLNQLNDNDLRDEDSIPDTAYRRAGLGRVEVEQPFHAGGAAPMAAEAGRAGESFRLEASPTDECPLRLNSRFEATPGPSFTFRASESETSLGLNERGVLVLGAERPTRFCFEPIDRKEPPPSRDQGNLSGLYRLSVAGANDWITLDEDRGRLRTRNIIDIRGLPPVFQVERQKGRHYRIRPLGSCGRSPSGLANEFVRLCDLEPPFRISPTDSFDYRRDDERFESVMVLHHIRDIQLYLQSLGFANANNRQMEIDPHNGLNNDESFYFGAAGAGRIFFGLGGVDDAEDAELIAHEYGHAIQDNQMPRVWTESDPAAAMGEGFGDYLAVSFFDAATRASGHDRPCFAEWNVAGDDNPCQRRVDQGEERNPNVTSPHQNGKVWSRTLWEMLNRLGRATGDDPESRLVDGRTLTDMLVIQSHFNAAPEHDFERGADAILTADQQLAVACRKLEPGNPRPPTVAAALELPGSRLEEHCRRLFRSTHEDQLCPIFVERGIFPAGCPDRAELCALAAERGRTPSGCPRSRPAGIPEGGGSDDPGSPPTLVGPGGTSEEGRKREPSRTTTPFQFGFRLWASVPVGPLDEEVDSGPSVSLDWQRDLTERWGLLLSLATTRFNGSPDELDYSSLTVAGRFYTRWERQRGYLDIGGGLYSASPGGERLGWLIGGGVELPIDEVMRVELGIQHHQVDPGGRDHRYFQVTSGIKFNF